MYNCHPGCHYFSPGNQRIFPAIDIIYVFAASAKWKTNGPPFQSHNHEHKNGKEVSLTPTWTTEYKEESANLSIKFPTLSGYPLKGAPRAIVRSFEHCSRHSLPSNLKAMLFTNFRPEKFRRVLSWSFRYIAARSWLLGCTSCVPECL